MARDNAVTGAAGVFHVASIFSMRGMIALPTIRNTAGYDIIVSSRDGLRHANVQVKTSAGFVTFFPICQKVTSVKTSEHDFYVLLRRPKDMNETYEGFMLTGDEMKGELEDYVAYCVNRGQDPNKFALCASIEGNPKSTAWSERWRTWTL